MKIPLSWLKEFLGGPFEVERLAHLLTMAGTEVSSVEVIGQWWEGVSVGLVTGVRPHPNADRLRLVTVDTGGDIREVVCGAPNVAEGQKIVYARIGANLIDGHTGKPAVLREATIRGVASAGMVCSEKELGISEEHEGILVLDKDAPLGADFRQYYGETVLDLEVTPNRPDLLSVIGTAREAAALLEIPAAVPAPGFKASAGPIEEQVNVSIESPELCPRYSASLIKGIEIGESPGWLKRRLINAGMRPINNVVDVTNYVMLEYGQPLHAFDFDQLSGGRVIVKRAGPGGIFTSLDDTERKLTRDMLMICDEKRQVAIAGVMGGQNSEVSPGTVNILLESASFNPASIHFTSSRLGLSSAASQRFERGISPFITVDALKRATALILEVAGGKAAEGIIDLKPGLKKPQAIDVSLERINALLGTAYTVQEVAGVLERLGCGLEPVKDGTWKVTPPLWRSDLTLEADIIEEVARIKGYDDIPVTMLGKSIPHQTPDPMLSVKSSTRQALVGLGFQEIVTWSMTSRSTLSRALNQPELEIAPLRLKKPMTVDQECLRTSLRQGLLTALGSNRRFEEGPIRMFELGSTYIPGSSGLPAEPQVAAGIISSARQKMHWDEEVKTADFYTCKGVVEAVLATLGVEAIFESLSDTGLTLGRQAVARSQDIPVAVLGQVNSEVARAFEISEPVFLFEIDLTRLLPLASREIRYKPIPRYPAVVRDIAITIDQRATYRQVKDIIQGFPLVARVEIFDVYTGHQVEAGKKSMAYRVTFQSEKKTLTDQAVDNIVGQIVRRLKDELGATLRS